MPKISSRGRTALTATPTTPATKESNDDVKKN